MKKLVVFTAVFLFLAASAFSGEASLRVGKSAASVHLVMGKNTEDSIAQVGADYEYGIIKHLSAGGGYVFVDGRHPLQAHGLNLYLKGYVFDSFFDLYGKTGIQIYFQDETGMVSTFLAGAEWQSPFKFYVDIEGGAELEGSDWGYLYGIVFGMRF